MAADNRFCPYQGDVALENEAGRGAGEESSEARMTIAERMVERMEVWPIERLTPYARNARTHSDAQVAQIAASIQRFGFNNPILVASDAGIVAGHGRYQAARKLGLSRVPVIVLDHLTETERRAYVIADNKIAENAGWDNDLLTSELAALNDLEFDLETLGFDARELEKILGASDDPAADECPALEERAITRLGDLWLLGRHRLLCGDATNADDVARLMAGAKASLFATDPPYGVAYNDETGNEASKFGVIANDENDGPRLQRFLSNVFQSWLPFLNDNAAWYLWHAQMTQGFFAAAAAAAAQLLIHRQIIWVKPSLVLGHGDYHWRHELCFYGWRKGYRAQWLGDRAQTTVWEIGRENDHIHPTQKPVEIFVRPITFHTTVGEVCAEPFAGSGTQFIAAEKTARRCFATEVDPRYCDVIIRRWQTYTGKQATRESDGRGFDELVSAIIVA
jgi:DNA modification methylase